MQVRAFVVVGGLVAVTLGAAARVDAQQGSLAVARDLYASAEYSGALTMLNGLLAGTPADEERRSIEFYRTLCLMAVGSTAEATQAIEAMIARDPAYRPSADDMPPRVRSAWSDARKRVLPAVVQQRYLTAKAAFDKQDFPAAAEGFEAVLTVLADPDVAAVAAQPPLSDLKLLASGFNDLTVKALAPPPPPVLPPPPPVVEPPPPPPVVEAAAPVVPRIYSADDGNVVPPLVVSQTIPPFPGRLIFGGTTTITVVIDVDGRVISATLDEPLNPAYDRIALNAARNWTYQPAMLDGKPVQFRKRIQLRLSPTIR